jgi:hypothetical protein
MDHVHHRHDHAGQPLMTGELTWCPECQQAQPITEKVWQKPDGSRITIIRCAHCTGALRIDVKEPTPQQPTIN